MYVKLILMQFGLSMGRGWEGGRTTAIKAVQSGDTRDENSKARNPVKNCLHCCVIGGNRAGIGRQRQDLRRSVDRRYGGSGQRERRRSRGDRRDGAEALGKSAIGAAV